MSLSMPALDDSRKRVLNAGSGPNSARPLYPAFHPTAWEETRLDIDPQAKPDIVGSVVNMRTDVASQSFDAVWCSHILEHLYVHEVPIALGEFKRVLKADGFALITCPDLETVAQLIIADGLDSQAYQSKMGPITPLDMLFGHSSSIARGFTFMAHKTGFTCARLGQLLTEAGFPTVLAKRDRFDLWALALMPAADKDGIQQQLRIYGLDLTEAEPTPA